MSPSRPSLAIQGILLAAGHGRRWTAAGGQDDKLLHRLPDGTPVVVAAAKALQAALPRSIAVVRPEAQAVADAIRACGLTVIWADPASSGMGENLAQAVRMSDQAGGWVVALGDMPHVSLDVIQAVTQALRDGQTLAAPFFKGQRGHPVGLGRVHREALWRLQGDTGAKALLSAHADQVHRVMVDDEGVLTDLDVPVLS